MSPVRMEAVPECILCGIPGRLFYNKLKDRLLGVPGEFDIKRCPECGLLWLDPRPAEEDIADFYQPAYFAPGGMVTCKPDSAPARKAAFSDRIKKNFAYGYFGYSSLVDNGFYAALGRAACVFPLVRSWATYGADMRIPRYKSGRKGLIVDVGCGNGNYLKMAQGLGWKVQGVEPSADAAAIARNKGLPVFHGTLKDAGLEPESADYIILSHVIEHVPDPVEVVDECFRVLKQGGALVVYTPNASSLGHAVFGKSYYHLDPPRHLFLFSPRNLAILCNKSKFREFHVTTSPKGCRNIFDNSRMISKTGATQMGGTGPQKGRALFAIRELLLYLAGARCGEEIELVARKADK